MIKIKHDYKCFKYAHLSDNSLKIKKQNNKKVNSYLNLRRRSGRRLLNNR